jgi:hypothetical protein
VSVSVSVCLSVGALCALCDLYVSVCVGVCVCVYGVCACSPYFPTADTPDGFWYFLVFVSVPLLFGLEI